MATAPSYTPTCMMMYIHNTPNTKYHTCWMVARVGLHFIDTHENRNEHFLLFKNLNLHLVIVQLVDLCLESLKIVLLLRDFIIKKNKFCNLKDLNK